MQIYFDLKIIFHRIAFERAFNSCEERALHL